MLVIGFNKLYLYLSMQTQYFLHAGLFKNKFWKKTEHFGKLKTIFFEYQQFQRNNFADLSLSTQIYRFFSFHDFRYCYIVWGTIALYPPANTSLFLWYKLNFYDVIRSIISLQSQQDIHVFAQVLST